MHLEITRLCKLRISKELTRRAHQTNSSLFEFIKMICFCFKSQLCLSSLVIDMRECQKTVTRNLASAAHQFMNSYYYYEKRAKRVYVVMIMLS